MLIYLLLSLLGIAITIFIILYNEINYIYHNFPCIKTSLQWNVLFFQKYNHKISIRESKVALYCIWVRCKMLCVIMLKQKTNPVKYCLPIHTITNVWCPLWITQMRCQTAWADWGTLDLVSSLRLRPRMTPLIRCWIKWTRWISRSTTQTNRLKTSNKTNTWTHLTETKGSNRSSSHLALYPGLCWINFLFDFHF